MKRTVVNSIPPKLTMCTMLYCAKKLVMQSKIMPINLGLMAAEYLSGFYLRFFFWEGGKLAGRPATIANSYIDLVYYNE